MMTISYSKKTVLLSIQRAIRSGGKDDGKLVVLSTVRLCNTSEFITWYICPACSKHYTTLDRIGVHFKNCPTEADIDNTKLKSFHTSSSVVKIKSGERSSSISILSSKTGIHALSSYHEHNVQLEVEPTDKEENTDELKLQILPNYVNTFLETSRFSWLIKNQTNQAHYRIAGGQLLAGAILVEGTQILLVNGVELYNRKSISDLYHERFGSKFMISSMPTMFNKYEDQTNIISKIEDKSNKLIIDTNVFNALAISSKRLDTNSPPEVGPFTYSFTPSSNTKIYVSPKILERMANTINNKHEASHFSEFESQLRQIRSSFTNPLS